MLMCGCQSGFLTTARRPAPASGHRRVIVGRCDLISDDLMACGVNVPGRHGQVLRGRQLGENGFLRDPARQPE